jgi:hypothetical protein
MFIDSPYLLLHAVPETRSYSRIAETISDVVSAVYRRLGVYIAAGLA